MLERHKKDANSAFSYLKKIPLHNVKLDGRLFEPETKSSNFSISFSASSGHQTDTLSMSHKDDTVR